METNSKNGAEGLVDFQDVEVLAFCIYMSEGCQEGRTLDNWLEAGRQLKENLFFNQECAQTKDQETDLAYA